MARLHYRIFQGCGHAMLLVERNCCLGRTSSRMHAWHGHCNRCIRIRAAEWTKAIKDILSEEDLNDQYLLDRIRANFLPQLALLVQARGPVTNDNGVAQPSRESPGGSEVTEQVFYTSDVEQAYFIQIQTLFLVPAANYSEGLFKVQYVDEIMDDEIDRLGLPDLDAIEDGLEEAGKLEDAFQAVDDWFWRNIEDLVSATFPFMEALIRDEQDVEANEEVYARGARADDQAEELMEEIAEVLGAFTLDSP